MGWEFHTSGNADTVEPTHSAKCIRDVSPLARRENFCPGRENEICERLLIRINHLASQMDESDAEDANNRMA